MKIIRINALWCPACLITKKYWKNIEKDYSSIEYIDLDYDFDDEALDYEPGDILPVVILFKDNKEVTRIIGEKSEAEIRKVLEKVYEAN